MGDPNDLYNVFKWKYGRLNLPGIPEKDPSMVWVAKVREDRRLAPDLCIYMEDLRPTGANAEECWRASRRVASVCNHLGI
jgi:hypothetical protein